MTIETQRSDVALPLPCGSPSQPCAHRNEPLSATALCEEFHVAVCRIVGYGCGEVVEVRKYRTDMVRVGIRVVEGIGTSKCATQPALNDRLVTRRFGDPVVVIEHQCRLSDELFVKPSLVTSTCSCIRQRA